ncbi:MAG: hypothetical protein ACLFV7_08110 [Phycisphaerae bacterium]
MSQNDDHAAALEALAAGEDTQKPPEQAAREAAQDEPAEAAPTVDLSGEGDAPTVDAAPRPSADEIRARQARLKAAQAKATGHQVKKTMIPLGLVSGVVLLLLGGLTAIMTGGDQAIENDMFDGQTITLLMIAAFVVGPILIVGAWLLHQDVKRSDQ